MCPSHLNFEKGKESKPSSDSTSPCRFLYTRVNKYIYFLMSTVSNKKYTALAKCKKP